MERPEKSLVAICERRLNTEFTPKFYHEIATFCGWLSRFGGFMTTERQQTVLNFLEHGMKISGERLTYMTLGNRSGYIGLSDLAKYSECPRAALAAKVLPKDDEFGRLLAFSRGHWIEQGIGDALSCCGYPIMPQLEISLKSGTDVPIKAHLDFVLFAAEPEPKVRVVEVKSMSSIPDEPYPQHEFQVNAQGSMLKEFWNQPVFTLRNEYGHPVFEGATFPEICKGNFATQLPNDPDDVSIEAWLLCVSMKEAVPFGPYTSSPSMIDDVLVMAEEFWAYFTQIQEDAESLILAPHKMDFSPFCCSCQYNGDCPKFCDAISQPQWEAAIAKWESLKSQKSACEAELKELDAAIRQAYQLSGTRDWITAGRYRFRVSQMPGRKSLNKGILRDELAHLFACKNIDMDVPALLTSCEREGAPYTRLNISTINSASAA